MPSPSLPSAVQTLPCGSEIAPLPRRVYEQAGANHQLHFLDVPDDVCRERLRRRNAAGTHDFAASDEEFDLITSHFMPPFPDSRAGTPAVAELVQMCLSGS
jgi:hypothetical protein